MMTGPCLQLFKVISERYNLRRPGESDEELVERCMKEAGKSEDIIDAPPCTNVKPRKLM
jgi:transposase